MKFTGQQVSLTSSSDGVVIKMSNGTDTVELVLTTTESTQLMSFLMSIFGLVEVYEEDGFEPIEQERKVH